MSDFNKAFEQMQQLQRLYTQMHTALSAREMTKTLAAATELRDMVEGLVKDLYGEPFPSAADVELIHKRGSLVEVPDMMTVGEAATLERHLVAQTTKHVGDLEYLIAPAFNLDEVNILKVRIRELARAWYGDPKAQALVSEFSTKSTT